MKTTKSGSKKTSRSKPLSSKRRTENTSLRKEAEEKLRAQTKKLNKQFPDDLENVIHELQVHQIELEMQNEELRSAQLELEASRSRYVNLYDFAPTGYLSLDKNGLILDTNLTCAQLLGVERGLLIKMPFTRFIHKDSQNIFFLHRLEVLNKKKKHTCDIKMKTKDGQLFYARLESIAVKNTTGKYSLLRTAVSDVTDKWKAEEVLSASEERYRSYIEVTGQLGWITNADGEVEEDIPTWRRYTGQSIEEVKGWGWANALHPDDREHTTRVWKKSVLSKTNYEVEYRVRRYDGMYRHFLARGVPVSNKEGNIREWVGTCIDITDRKQAEHVQSRLQKRLEAQWHIAQMVDSDQRIICDTVLNEMVTMSDSRYGFYGFLNEDETFMLIHAWSEDVMKECAVHEKNLTFSIEKSGIWGNAIRERKVIIINDYNHENSNKKGVPEGHVSLEKLMVIPVFRKNRIVALGAVANRITDYNQEDADQMKAFLHSAQLIREKHLAEEELSLYRHHLEELVEKRTKQLQNEITERSYIEEELKLMALFAELNPAPVLRFDSGGTILMANPSSLEIFDRKHLDGVPLGSVIPGTGTFDFADCIRNGKILFHPAEIGERSFLFIFRGIPQMNVGHIYGSDISGLKRAEAEAIRVGHLASLGQLAAGVAHEINNPVNGIINYAELLTEQLDPDSEGHTFSSKIMKEGHRIADIVNSLLTFARDSKGEKKQISLSKLMNEALILYKNNLEKEGITLRVNIPETLPKVVANPQKMEQVFVNIINNAQFALNKKYNGQHVDKILEITGEKITVKNKDYARITFYDRGIGIPDGITDKVINPFFTTKRSGEGTGLGMSISHGIISDHGGSLIIDSIDGEHTKVMIDLPLKD
jgi:PAS domain S-box-containing protein